MFVLFKRIKTPKNRGFTLYCAEKMAISRGMKGA